MKRSLTTQIAKYSFQFLLVYGYMIATTSCIGPKYPTDTHPGKKSRTTGWAYNKEGGLTLAPFTGQQKPPGMNYLQGGRTHAGEQGNIVTVTAFFADQTVITNIAWTEYREKIKDISEEAYLAAQQDPEIFNAVAHNDALKGYADYPGFHQYPALVSYDQAKEYCKWRTQDVNRKLALDAGKNYDPESGDVPQPDSGLVVPDFRLLTEAEWEYAARGEIGTLDADLVQKTQRIYSWDGLPLREQEGPNRGKLIAKVKRGPGDYKGLPGENDSICPTFSVFDGTPNDWGLFIAQGNVREMVEGPYRPQSAQKSGDMNPVMPDLALDPQENYQTTYPLINDDTVILKGASWADPFDPWLKIGERRYRAKSAVDAYTGFRCAVTSTSSQ